MKNKLAASFLTGLLAAVSLLGACGGKPENTSGGASRPDLSASEEQTPEERFGPEDYNADVAVLSLEEIPGVGEGIIYRAPDSLEKVIAASREPVVLCIYDEGQSSLRQVIPYLEQLAADKQGEAVVIMASNKSEDEFLQTFDQQAWPVFYVIHEASVVRTAYGLDEKTIHTISRTLADLRG